MDSKLRLMAANKRQEKYVAIAISSEKGATNAAQTACNVPVMKYVCHLLIYCLGYRAEPNSNE